MLTRLLILLLVIFSAQLQAQAAKIYVWRNDAGELVFSDSPMPGAEEVDVKDKSNNMPSIDTSILDIKPKPLVDNFEVTITQPTNNATIRDNTGSVFIGGLIKPVFKQGFLIQLYLDGKAYDKPQPQAMFSLRDIERGEHQLKLELINNTGKVIASSKIITFYMHRNSSISAR